MVPPSTAFPEGFDISHTPNHCANGETSIRFVKNIILPYISVTRKDLGLSEEQMSLLLENNILSVIVPSNCTDLL